MGEVEQGVAKSQKKEIKSKPSRGWLDKFDKSLQRFADASVREMVLEGSERLTQSSSPKRRADWVRGAMERLEASIPDEETKRQIMLACCHVFPKTRIKKLRGVIEKTGSIYALLTYSMRIDLLMASPITSIQLGRGLPFT